MLRWALIFFVVSIVAGLFGYTGIAADAASAGKGLVFAAIALFIVVVVLGVRAFSGKR